MMLVALGNYENNSLDTVGQLMHRDDVVLGLGDGGAHYRMICDASFPFILTQWTRDRAHRQAVGYKADLNVIHHAALHLHKPVVVHDLPEGPTRISRAGPPGPQL